MGSAALFMALLSVERAMSLRRQAEDNAGANDGTLFTPDPAVHTSSDMTGTGPVVAFNQ